jgi:hypothetical protein
VVQVEIVMRIPQTLVSKPKKLILMTTEEIIIHIFCAIDDQLGDVPKVSQAELYQSEVVTISILFALSGGHFRAFCRSLKRDYDALFGGLPDRTTLQRPLFKQQAHADRLLAAPFCSISLTRFRGITVSVASGSFDTATAQKRTGQRMLVDWSQTRLGAAYAWSGCRLALVDNELNLKLCVKGTWNDRMTIETCISLLTVICQAKHMFHRTEAHLDARFAYSAAVFNVLTGLDRQLRPDHAFTLSNAEFTL